MKSGAVSLKVLMVFLAIALLGTACKGRTSSQATPSEQGPTIAAIKQRGVLRAGVAISPPHLMQDPRTGEYFGAGALIAKRLGDTLGVKAQLVESDWGLFVAGLQADKFDLTTAALFATPERKKVIDFVNFTRVGQCYIVLKSNAKVNSLDDLNKPTVKIGTLTGSGGDQLIRAKYKQAIIDDVPGAPGQIERLQDVLARRIDASFVDSWMAPVYAAKFPQIKIIPDGPEACVKNPDVPVDVGIGLKKGDAKFKEFVQGVISGMQNDIDAEILKYSTEEFLKVPK